MKALLDALKGLDFEHNVSLSSNNIGHIQITGFDHEEDGESLRVLFARPFENSISFAMSSVMGRSFKIEAGINGFVGGEFERGKLLRQKDLIERLNTALMDPIDGSLELTPYTPSLTPTGIEAGILNYFNTEKEASSLIDVLVNAVEENEFTLSEDHFVVEFDSHRMSPEKLMFSGKFGASLPEGSFVMSFVTTISVVGSNKLELATKVEFRMEQKTVIKAKAMA